MSSKDQTQLAQQVCIQTIGNLLAQHAFDYSSEKQLQDGIEQVLAQHNVTYQREARLSSKDIVDFVLDAEGGQIAMEIKIDGNRNALLRQIGRYLQHDTVACVFVVGTPHWILNLPQTLSGKQIYCHRILSGMF